MFKTKVLCSSIKQDLETFDLEDFRYNSVNITAFRLVDVDSKLYLEVIDHMQKLQHNGLEKINGVPYFKVNSQS